MNPREPSRTPSRVRPSPRILALLLLPVLAPEQAGAAPRPRPSAGVALRFIPEPPIAYLRSIDPTPLRFAPEPAPPAPWPEILEPGAVEPAAPETASDDPATQTPAPATDAAVDPSSPARVPTPATAPEAARPETSGLPTPASPETPMREPSPILADELRPTVRPEDFLPYFILPGSAAGEAGPALIVPVSPQPSTAPAQPPSSARFIQTR